MKKTFTKDLEGDNDDDDDDNNSNDEVIEGVKTIS
jgi:hypothetical protein